MELDICLDSAANAFDGHRLTLHKWFIKVDATEGNVPHHSVPDILFPAMLDEIFI